MFAFGESVTVTRQGSPTSGFDDAGNPIMGTPTTFTINGVGVAPLSAEESTEAFGDVNVSGFRLFLPLGSGLLSTDTVTVRGVTGLQVHGNAGAVSWRSPFTGWTPGDVAIVRRAS